MSKIDNTVAQVQPREFVTDGGLETTLIFEQGLELPYFAAFVLLETESGRRRLVDYYRRYTEIADAADCGFILESPTWRANPDWGKLLGYDHTGLDRINREAIELMDAIRGAEEPADGRMLISGCIGPRGDGYVVKQRMTPEEARKYHRPQVASFAAAGADMVTGLTMTYPDEAVGITRASVDAGLPVVVSFTTETNGLLPDGSSLRQAIETVDAATDGAPDYYMLNCVHPDHFREALIEGEAWTSRIRGIRANASRMSHAELDESDTLDDGNPQELGDLYRQLRSNFPGINVVGGCCGTDHRHVSHMCGALS